jgi:uncharacterized OsmC-like protein
MDVEILYHDGLRFDAMARGHRVICDQPAENGGADAGMKPTELLLASLGTCTAFYALEYLKTRGLPTAGLKLRVTADMVRPPARLDHFRIELTVPDLDPRHHDGVLRAAKACLIHHTLVHEPSIEIVVNAPVGV